MIFSVRHIDTEMCVTSKPRVEPEASLRAEDVVVGEVLILVDKEVVVTVLVCLKDRHQRLEDGGECVHGVRGAPHQEALTPRGRGEAVQEVGVRGAEAWGQDRGHGEAVCPHQLRDRGLVTKIRSVTTSSLALFNPITLCSLPIVYKNLIGKIFWRNRVKLFLNIKGNVTVGCWSKRIMRILIMISADTGH